MPSYVMIATANAKAGQEDEFNTWYDTVHLPDICSIPGIKSGRRLEALPNAQTPTRYLTIYELETDDPDGVAKELYRRAGAGELQTSSSLDTTGAGIVFYRTV